MIHLVIDGDSIVYRAACAVQERIYVKDLGLPTEETFPGVYKKDILAKYPDANLTLTYKAEPVENALHIAKHIMTKIMEECMDEEEGRVLHTIFLTNDKPTCFRYQIAKTQGYKENRKDPRPVHFRAVREYLIKQWGAEVADPLLEADDAVGILASSLPPGITPIIVGIDKDLDTIQGLHYNFVTNQHYAVSEVESYKNFFTQMLAGDGNDNVPGIKGIGAITAEKMLDYESWANENGISLEDIDVGDLITWMNDQVLDAYFNHFNGEDDYGEIAEEKFEEMFHLLWILRSEDQLADTLVLLENYKGSYENL